MIRNKLVHRARIDHPLLSVVSERAKNRLCDLLRDISTQLTAERIDGSVDEVLTDYRDTFDELLNELGAGPISPDVLIQRTSLAWQCRCREIVAKRQTRFHLPNDTNVEMCYCRATSHSAIGT
ncbi:MAG: hypothetical protein F9B45_15440 [Phycisphaera sp. RhM]|nr:hypothetical protein [Phycisphaera sp. RhM]